jgi:hypothetical protein
VTKRVFKYPVPVRDELTLQLPAGAEVLTVQVQNGAPVLWALVDDTAPTEARRFIVRGTGHAISGAIRYVGTFQLEGGAFIGHLFETCVGGET